MLRIINYLLFFIVILLGVSFATLNADKVAINYYFGQTQIALSLLLVIVFGIGLIVGLLISSFLLVKEKAQNRRLKSRIKLADQEVSNLRNIPLQDRH